MPRFAAAVTAFALGAALSGAAAADPTIYYLETGHTGAQTQIDTNHTTSWSFNATWGWTLGGGNFVMKDGVVQRSP